MHEPARLAPGAAVALAWWAVIVLVVAFSLRGGVDPRDQALLHVLVGVGAAIAASLPGPVLGTLGAVRGWLLGGLAIVAALLVGLVPLPSSALAVVAPGLLEAWPGTPSHTLSHDFEATLGELATALLVIGYGLVVGVWGALRRRRHLVERAIVAGAAVLVTVGIAHRALGLEDVFGVVGTTGERGVLWGPLVNENHMATAMLLGLPVAAAQLFEHWQFRDVQWGLATYVVVAGLGLLVAIGSPGALLAGLVVAVVAAAARGDAGRWAAPLATVGLVAVAAVAVIADDNFVGSSVATRSVQWRDSARALADHWLAGVGGGAYGAAFLPYRSDGLFRALSHAHSDALEWVVETGAVGLVLGGVAAVAWWPRRLETEPARASALVLGVLAVLIHAFVDFPLQIPAVAMAVAAVLVCRLTAFVPRVAISPWLLRAALLGMALVQAPLAAWQLRTAVVNDALESVQGNADAATIASASAVLERYAPWRSDAAVLRAWDAERRGDRDGAVAAAEQVLAEHGDDADALRKAGLVFARARQLDRAFVALERAGVRGPSDQRNWVALARLRKAAGDVDGAVAAWDRALATSRPGQNVEFGEPFWLRPDVSWVPLLADSHGDWSAILSMYLLRTGKPEDALVALEQAARLEPFYADNLEFAEAMAAAGRPADAEAWLRERQARHPDADGYVALGRTLTSLGRHAEATSAFTAAVEMRPHDAEARVLAIRSVEADQGRDAAVTLARRYEASGRGDARISLEIARILRDGGDKIGCIGEIENHALGDGPLAADARALLASCR